jgi:hypothetical protein
MTKKFTKDPGARLDYQIDWSDWLDADTISTSAWTVPSGITQYGSATNTTTTATIWFSGGTAGSTYEITNQITTAAGRINEQTFSIRIAQQ